MTDITQFSDLKGHTLASVRNIDDETLLFVLDDGREFKLWHCQECCESVTIESIVGDLADLVGSPLTLADEVESLPPSEEQHAMQGGEDSFTWTFYKLATIKGYVDVRWFGSSNGYYSESVDFSPA